MIDIRKELKPEFFCKYCVDLFSIFSNPVQKRGKVSFFMIDLQVEYDIFPGRYLINGIRGKVNMIQMLYSQIFSALDEFSFF